MKEIKLVIVLAFLSCNSCDAQSASNIEGRWRVENGRFTKNYGMQEPGFVNTATFSKDSLKLASGFFYATDNLAVDEYPNFRFPFVFYGQKEQYKIVKDSLYLYSKPYNMWHSFKIEFEDQDHLKLTGRSGALSMVRIPSRISKPCSITYIRAQLLNFEVFKVDYTVLYKQDDTLIFEGVFSDDGKIVKKRIKLKSGTFRNICENFDEIDFSLIKDVYKTNHSDFSSVIIEIGFDNGSIVKSELQSLDYPDDLRLAITPVLYGHQQYLYSHLPPK